MGRNAKDKRTVLSAEYRNYLTAEKSTFMGMSCMVSEGA